MAFHDTRLHDTIDVALHALAIDEQRGPFRPTLFTLPEGTTLASHQHVEQTWFAGTHADVGGGWPETELSDIALLWMAERAAATTGLAIDIDKLKEAAKPDPFGLQHFSATGWVYAFSRLVPFVRLIRQDLDAISPGRRRWFRSWRTGKLKAGLISLNETIHESALARLGQEVREARGKTVREITYQPQNSRCRVGASHACRGRGSTRSRLALRMRRGSDTKRLAVDNVTLRGDASPHLPRRSGMPHQILHRWTIG